MQKAENIKSISLNTAQYHLSLHIRYIFLSPQIIIFKHLRYTREKGRLFREALGPVIHITHHSLHSSRPPKLSLPGVPFRRNFQ